MGLMLNLTCLAVLGVIAYVLGRQRALKLVNGDTRALHSLPGHYGAYVLFWAMVPGILVLVLGLGFGDYMAESRAFSQLEAANPGLASEQLIER